MVKSWHKKYKYKSENICKALYMYLLILSICMLRQDIAIFSERQSRLNVYADIPDWKSVDLVNHVEVSGSIWFLPLSFSLCDLYQYSLIPTSCVFSFPACMDSHCKRCPSKTHVFLDSLNPTSHIHIYTHTALHSNKQYAYLTLRSEFLHLSVTFTMEAFV